MELILQLKSRDCQIAYKSNTQWYAAYERSIQYKDTNGLKNKRMQKTMLTVSELSTQKHCDKQLNQVE